MFDRLKSLFQAVKPRTVIRQLQARFDAAQTTHDNVKHWAAADHYSADQEARPEVRRILRMRSRYEVANNSYAKGLVQMLANDTIGTGPRLQMLTGDEGFNDEVEAEFSKWSEAVGLAGKLRTMRVARCQDGESFAALDTNPKVRHPVKMDITVIEADRITGDLAWEVDQASVDGITFDAWGNPESYRVLKYHPGEVQYADRRGGSLAGAGGVHGAHLPARPAGPAPRGAGAGGRPAAFRPAPALQPGCPVRGRGGRRLCRHSLHGHPARGRDRGHRGLGLRFRWSAT
jgi:capsid protein